MKKTGSLLFKKRTGKAASVGFALKIGSDVTALVRVDHKERIIDVLHFALMLVQLSPYKILSKCTFWIVEYEYAGNEGFSEIY